jgi:predicted enzyme related to lactoylglutathione lyase
MRNLFVGLGAMTLALAPAAQLHAEPVVGVRSVRVGAADVARTAAFYQAVFGLKEISRVDREGLFEVIMNWGASVDEAKASRTPKVVVIRQPAGTPKDPVSHIILRCTEIEAVVAKALANGGKLERAPSKSASGSTVAFVLDPSDNRIELIQEPT